MKAVQWIPNVDYRVQSLGSAMMNVKLWQWRWRSGMDLRARISCRWTFGSTMCGNGFWCSQSFPFPLGRKLFTFPRLMYRDDACQNYSHFHIRPIPKNAFYCFFCHSYFCQKQFSTLIMILNFALDATF